MQRASEKRKMLISKNDLFTSEDSLVEIQAGEPEDSN